MLDEISEDTDNNSAKSGNLPRMRSKLVANRKKQQSAANSEAKHSVNKGEQIVKRANFHQPEILCKHDKIVNFMHCAATRVDPDRSGFAVAHPGDGRRDAPPVHHAANRGC